MSPSILGLFGNLSGTYQWDSSQHQIKLDRIEFSHSYRFGLYYASAKASILMPECATESCLSILIKCRRTCLAYSLRSKRWPTHKHLKIIDLFKIVGVGRAYLHKPLCSPWIQISWLFQYYFRSNNIWSLYQKTRDFLLKAAHAI